MNISEQLSADTVPAWGRGTAQYVLRKGGGLPAAYQHMHESD